MSIKLLFTSIMLCISIYTFAQVDNTCICLNPVPNWEMYLDCSDLATTAEVEFCVRVGDFKDVTAFDIDLSFLVGSVLDGFSTAVTSQNTSITTPILVSQSALFVSFSWTGSSVTIAEGETLFCIESFGLNASELNTNGLDITVDDATVTQGGIMQDIPIYSSVINCD